jgi:hypothetical protein
MYKYVKIWELEEELSGGTTKYLAIDVPDVTSPTGFTTKKINTETIGNVSIQNLLEVLSVDNKTGANPIVVESPSSIDFETGAFVSKLSQATTLTADEVVSMPLESGRLALDYDSGWKTINVFNGSFGLANTGNVVYRPKVRVIGRTVHIQGTYLLPLATTIGGGTLDGNGGGYVSKFLSTIYQGAGDGYTVRPFADIRSNSPILPTFLRPDENIQINNIAMNRTLNLNGRTKISTFVPFILLVTDGTILFTSIEQAERNGLTTSAFTKSMNERTIVSRFQNGDSMFEYDNYFTSFDGGFSTDKRIVSDTGVNWNFDHDGTTARDFGGMFFRFSLNYNVSKNYSLAQIKASFDSI